VPNNDRRFPGRQAHQLPGLGEVPSEWVVDKISSHSGRGRDAIFQVLWKSGDKTWCQYAEVKHLEPLTAYLEAMGASKIGQLKNGNAVPPEFDEEIRSDAVRVNGGRCSNNVEWKHASNLGRSNCTVSRNCLNTGWREELEVRLSPNSPFNCDNFSMAAWQPYTIFRLRKCSNAICTCATCLLG
jgi:hypothetical protein